MSLPEIALPHVVLPFEIPTLVQPYIDHFLIAIPMVILLIELLNLVMKKKAVSGITFLLIFIVIFAVSLQYVLGQESTGERQLLLTYLLLGSGALLFFKLILMLSQKIVLKLLYLLVLGSFVFGILLYSQSKNGTATAVNNSKNKIEVVESKKASTAVKHHTIKAKVVKSESLMEAVEAEKEADEIKPDVEEKHETLQLHDEQGKIQKTEIEKKSDVIEEVIETAVATPQVRERVGHVLDKVTTTVQENNKTKEIKKNHSSSLDALKRIAEEKVITPINDVNNTVVNGITDTTK